MRKLILMLTVFLSLYSHADIYKMHYGNQFYEYNLKKINPSNSQIEWKKMVAVAKAEFKAITGIQERRVEVSNISKDFKNKGWWLITVREKDNLTNVPRELIELRIPVHYTGVTTKRKDWKLEKQWAIQSPNQDTPNE